jgi:hypothetical protein
MSPDHFKSVKKQIGRCGIWCGSCVVGNGALAELTRRYGRLMDIYGLRDWGPKDFDFDEFVRGMHSIQEIVPCPGCIKGGGRDACELRSCVTARKLSDCSECGDHLSCLHATQLETMRSGARRAGMFVREPGENRAETLRKWIDELPMCWPHCVLFDEQDNHW